MQGIHFYFDNAPLVISIISNANLKHFNLTNRNISKEDDKENKIFCAKQTITAVAVIFNSLLSLA